MSPEKLLLLWFAVVNGLFVFSPKLSAQTSSVSLGWKPSSSPNISHYTIYYGTASGTYLAATNVGNTTSALISGLEPGRTYFFAATATDTSGVEGVPSNEATYSIAAPAPSVTLLSPIAGAAYSSPASVDASALVSSNGNAIARVEFFAGSNRVATVLAPPYSTSLVFTNSGTYTITARAFYGSSSSAGSAPVDISVNALPLPWQSLAVGGTDLSTRTVFQDSAVTVDGAGVIGGMSDRFQFAYQTLSGDGEIRVRVRSADPSSSPARIGVMIRETLVPGARNAFMGISGDGGFRWHRRISTGGTTDVTTSTYGAVPNIWVRLVRQGNTFTGYKSVDGARWTRVDSRKISMAPNIYVGIAVASGSTNSVTTSVLEEVSVIP